MFRNNNNFNLRLRSSKNIFVITGLLYLIIQLGSCGLFETRTPQHPFTNRSTFIPPTTPDAVLSNLNSAIVEKNSVNYTKCLGPVLFQFIPDSKAYSEYGVLFSSWNINSEKYYLDNLIAHSDQNSSSNLFLSGTVTSQLSSDSAVTTSNYIFVFQHNKVNIPKSANGNFKLTMKIDENGLFYISRWEDFRNHDTDFTWSEMKANFSN
jgi:hypothetical protein